MKGNLFLVLCLFLSACGSENENTNAPIRSLSSEEFALIQNGDIILKNGYGTLSRAIVEILDEPISISHCGILYYQNDTLWVLHSIAKEYADEDGVQKIAFNLFLNDTKPNSLYIVRFKSNFDGRNAFLEQGLKYLNQKTSFDYDFNNEDDSKLYCSEFVFQSLLKTTNKKLMKERKIQGKTLLTFNSLLDSANFETIIKK
jgi:hypothetical protein